MSLIFKLRVCAGESECLPPFNALVRQKLLVPHINRSVNGSHEVNQDTVVEFAGFKRVSEISLLKDN